MADSSTPLLQLVDQETGNNENTWGDILDANLLKIENAIAGGVFVSTTGGALSLSDDQARNAILLFTTGLTSNSVITVPTRTKAWIVRNAQTGNDGGTPPVDYTLTLKTAAGTGTVVRRGETTLVYCDGVNVYQAGLAPTATGLKFINAADAAAALAALGPTTLGAALFAVASPLALFDLTSAAAEQTLASGSTVDLGATTGGGTITSPYIAITGTTTITSFGTAPLGTLRHVRFAGILTLTESASLDLPGGGNILTASGDTMLLRSLGGGSWKALWYTRASGLAVTSPVVSGRIGQIQMLPIVGAISCPANVPFDDTKPQTGEMTLVATKAFTPQDPASTLIIEGMIYGTGTSATTTAIVGLFQDSQADPLGIAASQNPNAFYMAIPVKLTLVAGTILARNFHIKVGTDTGTFTVNGVSGARQFGGAFASFLCITEVLP